MLVPAPAAAGAEKETSLQPIVAAIAAVAALYFGREIFIPLALATLVTFALSPVVAKLRRVGMPRIPSVILVVTGALMGMVMFGAVVAAQLAILADNLPSYQNNITAKIRAVREAGEGSGVIDKAQRLLERLGREMERNEEAERKPEERGGQVEPATPGSRPPSQAEGEGSEQGAPKPIPVLISEPALAPFALLRTIVTPLIEPIATGGIVIVFVIFMLIRREDLRDRFIRLIGPHDIHRTTNALADAGRRVGRYLLMQLVVNTTYAIPVGIGLWLIGVPNALLWGMLALVLRFIPYIGPIIAALFPLALAIAVDPGWTMLLWAAALFIALELISNNFLEPWLYGSRTGLSPVAIILAAIFWTWLWGPIGLLLSTPLTVCLVVLGRHVPQFQFLDVLLGNEPVLSPDEQLYQRLLANDPDEATERAEEYLRENDLAEFYETVALPALVMAEADRSRGVLDEVRRERVAEGVLTLIDNLEEHEDILDAIVDGAGEPETADEGASATDEAANFGVPPPPEMPAVMCAGGRGNLDDAAAALLADILERAGSEVALMQYEDLESGRAGRIDLAGKDLIVVGYLNPESATHARYVVRRLRRLRRDATIIVGLWGAPMDESETKALAERVRCDAVVTSIRQTLELARDIAGEQHMEELARAEKKPSRPASSDSAKPAAKARPRSANGKKAVSAT